MGVGVGGGRWGRGAWRRVDPVGLFILLGPASGDAWTAACPSACGVPGIMLKYRARGLWDRFVSIHSSSTPTPTPGANGA